MKKKIKKAFFIFILSVCLVLNTTPVSYALTNPLLGLPFAFRANGFGHNQTVGSTYGVYGGVARLYPEITPAISAMSVSVGGGTSLDTGLRSYAFVYRVTFADNVTTSAYPCFSLAIDPSLISSVTVSYKVDGHTVDYDKNLNILYSVSSTGLFYTIDSSAQLDSAYIYSFENATFLNFSMPVGTQADNIQVTVSFAYYPATSGDTSEQDVSEYLLFPFRQSATSTVLSTYAAITENDFLRPYLLGGIFLLLAGMLGKFMM